MEKFWKYSSKFHQYILIFNELTKIFPIVSTLNLTEHISSNNKETQDNEQPWIRYSKFFSSFLRRSPEKPYDIKKWIHLKLLFLFLLLTSALVNLWSFV